MTNRVTVTIGNQSYTLVTSEDSAYVKEIAAYVDQQFEQVMEGSPLSISDGAILTTMNVAEQFFKEREAADNLRSQLKEYLDEASRLKLELAEAKREIFRLQNDQKKSD